MRRRAARPAARRAWSATRSCTLAIAHVDCDAFYAAVEKRDDPSLADKPLIIGGGKRGVVSTACYVARTYGIHSAMPMFKALQALPARDRASSPTWRNTSASAARCAELMFELTPQVEPLSIDEAFMDLTGTERLHGMSPARSLARFARRVEADIGITVSIGLSANKFLAKIASDLDKPRGFAVLGATRRCGFSPARPVGFIWGVGKASAARLQRDGFTTIADLQRADETDLMRRYGVEGRRLWRLSRGIDDRAVNPERETKSVSAETTFGEDIASYKPLEKILWSLSEKVSSRLKASALAGSTVQLKLKTADFRLRTRARSLGEPTQLAARIFAAGRDLLGARDRRHQIPPDRHRRLQPRRRRKGRRRRPDRPQGASAPPRPSTRSTRCAKSSARQRWSRAGVRRDRARGVGG